MSFHRSIRSRKFMAIFACILAFGLSANSWGQFGAGGGGLGGGGFGGGLGGAGFGGGGFGGGGGGGGQAGNFGGGGNGVVAPQQINIGSETRYIRDQRPVGSFVGADLQDSSNFYSQNANATAVNGAAPQQGGQGGNNGGQGGGQGGQQTNNILRRRYRIGFEYPSPSSAQVATISRRVSGLDQIRVAQQRSERSRGVLSQIQVTQQNGQVVLRGSVPTEADRALAERLVRLEPGVYETRNEITVAGNSANSPEAFDNRERSNARESDREFLPSPAIDNLPPPAPRLELP